MCNGSGSVRSSYAAAVTAEPEKVEVHPKHLYDLNRIRTNTYSKLNKNEFELYSKHILKHIMAGDARRAAVAFNSLIELASGQGHESEGVLFRDLQGVKASLDRIVTGSGCSPEDNHSVEFGAKVRDLCAALDGLYKKHFNDG